MTPSIVRSLYDKIYEQSRFFDIELVSGSTPVISFGDFTICKVATLGINPSSIEFVDTRGKVLEKGKKRLTDLETLGLTNTDFFESRKHVDEIWKGCQDYFNQELNPYWKWFGDLEKVLAKSNYSYLNSTVCHLDLFPLATKKMFSQFTKIEKFVSVTNFRFVLDSQLQESNIEKLIFNGATVFNSLQFTQNYQLNYDGLIKYKVKGRQLSSKLFFGETNYGQKIYGWTVNLQAFRGNGEEKVKLIESLNDWLNSKNKKNAH